MTVLHVILLAVVVFNGVFVAVFVRDLLRRRGTVLREAGSTVGQAISSAVIFFFSSFGISDFALSMVLYTRLKWVPIVRLPGTLNTQCVVPVAVMALCYLTYIEVDYMTLFVCIVAQITGAYLGARLVVKLNPWMVKRLLVFSLLAAAGIIVAQKVGLMPDGGDAMALRGWKLWLLGSLSLLYGAMINIGIGSYTLTMATVYALGMNPIAAFPIMMGASTFAVPVSGVKFIQHDRYSPKITLMTSTFGVLGVLVATQLVRDLDVSKLKWLVLASLLYAAFTMFLEIRREVRRRDSGMSTAAMRMDANPAEYQKMLDSFNQSRERDVK